MSPVDALHQTISHMCFHMDSKRRWKRPGQVVEMQPAEVREALSRLTSHDTSTARRLFLAVTEEEQAWVHQQTTGRRDASLAQQRWNNGLASRLKQAFDLKRRRSYPS